MNLIIRINFKSKLSFPGCDFGRKKSTLEGGDESHNWTEAAMTQRRISHVVSHRRSWRMPHLTNGVLQRRCLPWLPYLTPTQWGTIESNSLPFVCPSTRRVSLNPLLTPTHTNKHVHKIKRHATGTENSGSFDHQEQSIFHLINHSYRSESPTKYTDNEK